jgi:hypothetical protein
MQVYTFLLPCMYEISKYIHVCMGPVMIKVQLTCAILRAEQIKHNKYKASNQTFVVTCQIKQLGKVLCRQYIKTCTLKNIREH